MLYSLFLHVVSYVLRLALWQVLSDPEKRRLYDRLGREGVQGAAAAAGGMDQRQQADDLFRSFFGRFSQPQVG